MRKSGTLFTLLDIGIIPIFRTSSEGNAIVVAEALIKGSVPVLELPLSFPGSLTIITKVAKRFGKDLLLGAGTVLDPESVRDAIEAGAQYIVSPDSNPEVIKACISADVPCFPGALTPTEIENAIKAGASGIKVFPCNAVGGPAYIKSLSAPFPEAILFPCGGVNIDNAEAYRKAGASGLFTGASFISESIIQSERYDEITKNALKLASIIHSSRKNKP